MIMHHGFNSYAPFKLNKFEDLNFVPKAPSSSLRNQIRAGKHVWSIQASSHHVCSPPVDGDALLNYTHFEIAGWNSMGTPVNVLHDKNFMGFGLESRQGLSATSQLITYVNVPSMVLYRVLTHCLLLDLASPKPVVTASKGLVCPKCREHYPMAEANMPDGGFRCFACRSNPFYK